MKRLLTIRPEHLQLSGKAHQIWLYLRSIARAYGHLTLKELMGGEK